VRGDAPEAGPAVGDLHDDLAAAGHDPHLDLPTGAGGPGGVVEQVADGPAQREHVVHVHTRLGVAHQPHGAVGHRRDHLPLLRDQLADVHGPPAGVVGHPRLQQAAHLLGLPHDVRQPVDDARAAERVVRDDTGEGHDRRQRLPHVVAEPVLGDLLGASSCVVRCCR
jgi:hypothetical protein